MKLDDLAAEQPLELDALAAEQPFELEALVADQPFELYALSSERFFERSTTRRRSKPWDGLLGSARAHSAHVGALLARALPREDGFHLRLQPGDLLI